MWIALVVFNLFHLLIITKWRKKELVPLKLFNPTSLKSSLLKSKKILSIGIFLKEKSMFLATWMNKISKNATLSKSSKMLAWGTLSSKYIKRDFSNWLECSMQIYLTPLVFLDLKLRSTPFNYPFKSSHKFATYHSSIKSLTLILVANPSLFIHLPLFLLHSSLSLYAWKFGWFTIQWTMFSLQERANWVPYINWIYLWFSSWKIELRKFGLMYDPSYDG